MKKTKSVYARNLSTTITLLVFSFLLLGIAFAFISYTGIMRREQSKMSHTASEASQIIDAMDEEMDVEGLWVRMCISGLADAADCRIVLCNSDGQVVSCSDSELHCDHMEKTVPTELLDKLPIDGKTIMRTDLGGLYQESCFVIGIEAGENGDYTALISTTRDVMSSDWKQYSGTFSAIALIILLLTVPLTLYSTKKLTRPLAEIADAAHKFAKGDFSVRVSRQDTHDELEQLADAFNVMADSLERSEKERRELIANVSHELKTPMTTINGFAEAILDGTIPPEKQQEYLRTISSEAKRLSRMVRSMLDISQAQYNDPVKLRSGEFDADELVRVTLLSLEKKITDRGLDVQLNLPEESVRVLGNKDAVMQVMYNLIENAAKFAEPGSNLVIELFRQGPKAFFSVEDTGQTIPPEELPLVFDRFHKTDKSRSMDRDGVGLGLYIVKTILDNMNEDIFVTSENGKTKFTFSLTLKS